MEKFKREERKVWGSNMMDHGNTNFPNEFGRFTWAFGLTATEQLVIMLLRMANGFKRAQNQKPAYISQKELAAQYGVSQTRISQLLQSLQAKNFACPFCGYRQEGYIRVEPITSTAEKREGHSHRTWIEGFVAIQNHLARHYNVYMEDGLEGREKFKRDRDLWLKEHKSPRGGNMSAARAAKEAKQKARRGKVLPFRRAV